MEFISEFLAAPAGAKRAILEYYGTGGAGSEPDTLSNRRYCPRMRKIAWPVACALSIAGPFCFAAISDSDSGWHVAVGRLILDGAFPRTNALSWKWASHPWYATSWLYDVAAAAVGTPFGLQLLTFLFLAATAVCLALACETPWIVPAITLLLVPRLVPRPHVATWALLAAVLAFAPRSTRARAVCVGLVALGGNVHAGAAFAAFVLGLECVEAYARTRRPLELGLSLLAGVALLANPGVLFNAGYLVEHLTHVNDVVQLREFEPPSVALRPAFFVLLPIALWLSVQRRRERPALLVAIVVFAALGLRSLRMVSEAQIVFAPALAWGLARVQRPSTAVAGVVAALAAGFSLRLDQAALGLRLSPSWDDRALPVRAARFLDEAGIAGPGFNAFRDGGYLEAARKGVPAFIDGRVQAIPAEAWREMQEAEKSAATFQEYLERMGCEWAIATRVRERLGGYRLLNGPRWALVYWDETSEVFVRRDVARFAPLRERLEYRHFRPYGTIVGAVEQLDREGLNDLLREIDRFERTSPDDAFAGIDRCAALIRLRAAGAEKACDDAAARAPPVVARLVTKARSLAALP
jgi:hypothetical protein